MIKTLAGDAVAWQVPDGGACGGGAVTTILISSENSIPEPRSSESRCRSTGSCMTFAQVIWS